MSRMFVVVVVVSCVVSVFIVGVMYSLKKSGYSIMSVLHVPMHFGHIGLRLWHSVIFMWHL